MSVRFNLILSLLIAFFAHSVCGQSGTQADSGKPAEEVKIFTSDIDHFWQAYGLAQQDTGRSVAIFQQYYFEKGSAGLKDFLQEKILSVPRFVEGIRQKPAYYRSIRNTTLRAAALRPQILANLKGLRELYPQARFPDIYFLIGGYRSGGTVSPAGLLIGIDQAANGPAVNVSELTLVQRNRCAWVEDLPLIVTHELIHSLQKESDGTLLHMAINEGMADFIAGLVTHTQGANARLFAYGESHEQELWHEFSKAMAGKDFSHWIANGREETVERPCDLGYFLGYKICEAYYQQASDKKQAVSDMLNLTDAPAFLAKSGYGEKLLQKE